MKKSYPFNVLGSKRCSCGTRLKKRIEEEHPNHHKCFRCHVKAEHLRGHHMRG